MLSNLGEISSGEAFENFKDSTRVATLLSYGILVTPVSSFDVAPKFDGRIFVAQPYFCSVRATG